MKSASPLLAATFLLSAPDSPVFAADAAVPLKPIRGEVFINRIFLATEVVSEGLNLQDATRMTHCDFHWNPVRLKLD